MLLYFSVSVILCFRLFFVDGMEDQDECINDKAGVLVCFFTSLPFSLSCIPSWLFSSDCMKHCSVFEFIVPKKLVPLCQCLL